MYRSTQIVFVLILGILAPVGCFAAHRWQVGAAPPARLYHWTSRASLAGMATASSRERLALKTLVPGDTLCRGWPALGGRPGLFAWIHPVAGMGAGPFELYGGEVLLELEVAPTARVLQLTTDLQDPSSGALPAGVDGADLLLHRVVQGEQVQLQEWVVLRPGAIASFTADPRRLGSRLEPVVGALARPGAAFVPAQEHVPGNLLFSRRGPRMRHVLPRIRGFLALPSNELPEVFRAAD